MKDHLLFVDGDGVYRACTHDRQLYRCYQASEFFDRPRRYRCKLCERIAVRRKPADIPIDVLRNAKNAKAPRPTVTPPVSKPPITKRGKVETVAKHAGAAALATVFVACNPWVIPAAIAHLIVNLKRR
jgi:hypothetical protein